MDRISADSSHRITRRGLLKASLLGAAGLGLYAGEIERHWIEETQIDIHLRGLADELDGLRIAQLTDIHMDEFTEPFFLHDAVRRINAMNPDVVLLTGDFVSEGPRDIEFAVGAAWHCGNLLNALKCTERYACMGNHDHIVGETEVTDALTANGIKVLNNSYLPIEKSGARMWLAGVDDPLIGRPNLESAIPAGIRNRPKEPVLLMCHGPDYADHIMARPVGQAVGLMLSGHTHGGQVRLPFLGPLTLPTMGRKYVEGYFRFGPMQLYVNRGIGTVGLPFRFDCPPEIALITLRAGG